MIPDGFITTAEFAEEFFRRCIEKEAVTMEERLKIMNDMKAERKVFPQTKEQIAKRVNGKNVLVVKKSQDSKRKTL